MRLKTEEFEDDKFIFTITLTMSNAHSLLNKGDDVDWTTYRISEKIKPRRYFRCKESSGLAIKNNLPWYTDTHAFICVGKCHSRWL